MRLWWEALTALLSAEKLDDDAPELNAARFAATSALKLAKGGADQ